MEHTGHRERLRMRFEQNQLNGFSDHEVLELMLTYAIPRVDVNPLAHRLMDRFGSLSGVMEATAGELMQVKGMGERSAAFITMLLPVLRRYRKDRLTVRTKIKTYAQLAEYCASLFIGCHEERFYLLCFDAKLQLTKEILIGTGSMQAVQVLPRQVVREAMRANAVSVVVTHNHPSGMPEPSQADADLTCGIRDALQMVEIKLVDHVVVGTQAVYSFQRDHVLPLQTEEDTVYMAAEDNRLLKRMGTEKNICREDEELLWD